LFRSAMVSATDPVSVVALFRQMGMDKRLTMILEGESLFNDGTAVVLFQLVLAMVLSGGKFSLATTAGSFAVVVAGGALLGVLVGFVASRITSAFDDHLLEITLTMITAYGSFLLAEHLKISPVIAVVAAGIVVGNYGSRSGMSVSTRLAVNSFWEYAAFLVNSLLFLLIGLQVEAPLLLKHAELIGYGVLAVIVARMLVVYGICPFVSTELLPIPDKWRHLLFWGGLRGALVMALAMSLPIDFPERELIINMTFGVVLFTLLVPGLTMGPLVSFLGMAPSSNKLHKYQESRALLLAYKSELRLLNEMQESGRVSANVFESIRADLQKRLGATQHDIDDLELSDTSIEQISMKATRVQLLESRKDFLAHLCKQGVLTEDSLHHLKISIDAEQHTLSEPLPLLESSKDDSAPGTNSSADGPGSSLI
ncbi:MAG: cation:proton antiporter, partial [Candidatus Obscuribacterales bacterium]|nr:cation:proton antiporter [Candidatus Obscuribacterales bacterium]